MKSVFFACLTTAAMLAVQVTADDAAEPASAASSVAGELDGNRLAPKAFRAAANRVVPCLVSIESLGGVASAQGSIGGIRRQGEGPTTGLIISADGYIITSTFNFIQKPPIITVIFPDGQRRVAELLGRDDTRKICLLKVEGVEDLPTPEFVPRSDVKVGQWAVSVGVGFGDRDPAISAGIISATSRIGARAVQTDANTSPANYGGPLVDIEGRVIGICVPLSPQSQEAGAGVEWYDSGIGFAVPLHGADNLIAALKEGKNIRQGYLGIQPKAADDDSEGIIVEKVIPDSAAAKAGLEPGDRIISVNGEKVLDPTHLRNLIGQHIEGDAIKMEIRREDEAKEIEATLGGPPQQATPAAPMPSAPAPNRR